MHLPAKTAIQRCAFAQSGFFIGRQAVLASKSRRRTVLVLVIPIVRYLLIVLAELDIVLVLSLVVSLAAILRDRNGCSRQN